MKCIFPNNHVVAVINDRNYLVDMGSPISFALEGPRAIDINGRQWGLMEPLPMAEKPDIDKLVGADISGVIGNDIFTITGLTINKKNGTIDFSCNSNEWGNAPGIDYSVFGMMGTGHLLTEMVINNIFLPSVILDTGAQISYVGKKYLNGCQGTGEMYEDFSPEIGMISGEFFKVGISTPAGKAISLKVGELPAALEMLGMDAIINPMELADEAMAMDAAAGKMYFR